MQRRHDTHRAMKCRMRKKPFRRNAERLFQMLLNRDAQDLDDLSVDVADLTGYRCQAGTSISRKAPRNQWQRFSQ